MLILGPLAAALIQAAISRSREFNADSSGAQMCGNPMYLASALENPPPDAGEVTRLGKEYTRVQEQMDEQLAEWERLTG